MPDHARFCCRNVGLIQACYLSLSGSLASAAARSARLPPSRNSGFQLSLNCRIPVHMLGKRPPIPDDTVFFAIFPPPNPPYIEGDADCQKHLHGLRTECLDVILPLVSSYIWQHQAFDLAPSASNSPCPCNNPPDSQEEREVFSVFLPHLHGKVKYGDNIDDEWFVVYLLYAISRHLPDLSIRVWDTDGEFLLIEAAYWIPRWLKPENSSNRVFIRQGSLHILPLPSSPADFYHLPLTPSVKDAVEIFNRGSIQTRAANPVQAAIQRRVGSYGENCKNNMHSVVCRVPLAVAQLLKHEPQLVSLAVEAFYERDLDSMKAASRMEQFLPNMQVEMVTVMVRMSRTMYAQLMQQVFQAPRCYPMLPFSDPHRKEAELGMKLTCGFEMMYWERSSYNSQDSDVESEVLMQAEKVLAKDIGWQAFLSNLQQTGYFMGLLEGSKGYRELMDHALNCYRRTNLFSRTSAAMHAPIQRIKDILALPHSDEDFANSQDLKSDDDSWLYNGDDDLINAMLERQKEMDMYTSERAKQKKGHLHANNVEDSARAKKTMGNFNAEDVARSMHSFINKVSSFEGAEFPDDDNKPEVDDESVSIRMGKFLKELRSVVGPNMELPQQSKAEDLLEEMDTSSSDMNYDDSESDILNRMDKEHCLVSDSPSTSSYNHNFAVGGEENEYRKGGMDDETAFMEEYKEALSHELNSSSLAKSFISIDKQLTTMDKTEGTREDEESLPPVNVDVNLLQNLLQSYSLQQGLPGPASNLLGAMGLYLPDNKDKE